MPGVQWGSGAMGNALWTGVRLRDVLQRAGVAGDALEVVFNGADSAVLPQTPDFVKSLPLERALDANTLIAFAMNGEPLPHWNGAPVRLVVPGWTGTYWMKHLTEIRITPTAFDGFWMKSAYRVPTGAFPGARFASQETPETTPITEILVNSLITRRARASGCAAGRPAAVVGKAWDNGAGIATVEVSTDGRRSWRPAVLGNRPGTLRVARVPAAARHFAPRSAGDRGARAQPQRRGAAGHAHLQSIGLSRQHRADRVGGGRMRGARRGRLLAHAVVAVALCRGVPAAGRARQRSCAKGRRAT